MNEYKPLNEHFPLEEGTVLVADAALNAALFTYRNENFYKQDSDEPIDWNPFIWHWRIVSTPSPKRLEFETAVMSNDNGREFAMLPDNHGFEDGTPVRVTVEVIR